ncbi:MAG: 30S ribosomal protein S20 [Pseudomonadota bacterium]|nr:30S ribosomal protein S20 [Pseudomonadota bacterium]MDO7710590.1 30S ribosomal protein S20 [Pseudomonadota bacterium]
MANSAQAKKRARQAEDNRQRNTSQRSEMRTSIKKLKVAITSGDKDLATAAFKAAVPFLDKMARKGLVHKNSAARSKSRLNNAVRAL